jgi:hypothetical protein
MARARGADGVGWLRGAVLFVGVCQAAGATVAMLGTKDPRTLRLAVIAALWAFLLAALAVPRRSGSGSRLSRSREIELRRTYEIELEREVAARREYELQLEVYLRRELEQGMRRDVDALRDEVQRMRSEVLDRLDGEVSIPMRSRAESLNVAMAATVALYELNRIVGHA